MKLTLFEQELQRARQQGHLHFKFRRTISVNEWKWYEHLHIIDVEGSESSKTMTTGIRRKKGSYINKSLLTLGTFIYKRTDCKAAHITYRDSKLKRLLQSSLISPANRLQIRKCNLRISPTLKSKEPTIQVVLDALKLSSFYNAFEITTDVPEIYMQEFWVTASRHHSLLCFKMNGKSHTVNIDNFRDMLEICPKLPGQKFKDPPLEEENLSSIRDLGHTGEIKFLFDVNNKNVDYVYLLWEDLVYQVENKNSKKNNDMYYPRFTKVITYGAILPQPLTNQAILEFEAYMTYHAYATGEKIPKPKYVKNKADSESSPKKKSAQASKGKRIKTSTKLAKPVKKKQPAATSKEKGLNVLFEVAFSEAEHIKLATKRSLIQTHSSHASGSSADEGTGVILGVPDVPTYNFNDEQISWKSSDEDDVDEVHMNVNDHNDDNADNEGDDDNEQTELENDDDDLVHPKLSTFDENERQDKEDKEEEWSDDEAYDDKTQGVNFEDRVKALEDNFLKFQQTNQFAVAVSSIPSIVDTYLANKIYEAIKTAVQLQSDRLRDEAQAKNENFINTLDENMRKIIKKQVNEQVKEQVSKILPKIKKFINNQLEAEVLTRSSNQAKTSHVVAANLSELELKKILIDKMKNNKSIDRSIQQKTLYKALVDAYETDKDIFETYGDTVTFKRRQDDEDNSNHYRKPTKFKDSRNG
ncbi:retrovirus-related pol polyprotein from transposon TNT 1-94 [Tanacetum coccineum]|uniref:Retrovirus-related pol polyprotein from transposon TNT 1-94 n=1 Tax=Tanacetum coccineum TaxID=301880 RepID=A0ABQ4X3X4_9ASTR